jgi:hypothetical protein
MYSIAPSKINCNNSIEQQVCRIFKLFIVILGPANISLAQVELEKAIETECTITSC